MKFMLSQPVTNSPRRFVGIDNGMSGAVAELGADGTIQLHDIPLRPHGEEVKTVRENKGKLRRDVRQPMELDPDGIARLARKLAGEDCVAVIERFQIITGANRPTSAQGIARAAWGNGIWLGALAVCGVPCFEVEPKTWQRRMIPLAKGPKLKGEAVKEASRRFPEVAHLLRGPRGGDLDGRADALLLAEWLRDAVKHDARLRQLA